MGWNWLCATRQLPRLFAEPLLLAFACRFFTMTGYSMDEVLGHNWWVPSRRRTRPLLPPVPPACSPLPPSLRARFDDRPHCRCLL